ncbi:hypothetical protein FOQG_18340 [Fusarium oxysporum f. sp. raphani 54005]|uniref:C2H2-type domain-containing protein n=1 Tax=Fusarium oxysporum f. sp. raphani 54005 TaxID=1089458 RepID=X0B477_FUSOX|nr:hypothetical protein FOQG_18340 [Fusarium oxysporum f. sp. raphani 54005]
MPGLAVLFDSGRPNQLRTATMIGDNQTCAEFKSVSPEIEDWPHLALSVDHEEETTFQLPTCQEQVDEICTKLPKHVALQYTTIDIETVPKSSPKTVKAITYQEKWEKDVELWFKKSNYRPVAHKTLNSEPFCSCYQGLERFAAYGRLDHSIDAWEMRLELKHSDAMIDRHHWVFELLTLCTTCDRYYHEVQQHECNRKCIWSVEGKQCGRTFHGDLNIRRHQKSQHNYTPTMPDWCGHEVRVIYNLHLLGYSADDISKEIPGRPQKVLEFAIKEPIYGCQDCQKVFRKRGRLQDHSRTKHDVTQTHYYCYKCDKAHEFESWDACLGKQRRLDLGDREEMNTFYEMQLMFLAQLDAPDSQECWRMYFNGPHMKRSEFWSALCTLLSNRIQRVRVTVGGDKHERKMLAQLLRVAQCEQEVVSQGKGDRVIDVSSGNLDWYKALKSKARDGDKRLSAAEMGFVV